MLSRMLKKSSRVIAAKVEAQVKRIKTLHSAFTSTLERSISPTAALFVDERILTYGVV